MMSKLRTDSWAAGLTEEQSWQLYYKARGLKWNEAAQWAVKEFGVESPSRTAFYAWVARMRSEESAHRLEQAATAAAEAAALARKTAKDEALIGAYKAMAAELALRTGSANITLEESGGEKKPFPAVQTMTYGVNKKDPSG